MKLLDLYCGAGGAAMGYHRAGFDHIVGVDIEPQPNYPFTFIQGDALDPPVDFDSFDLIHASPPCQVYSALHAVHKGDHPDLVGPTRRMLDLANVPYIIENVVGAPLINPVRLCGSSFGLRVWRHRLFEMTTAPVLVPPCSHYEHPAPIDVTGTGAASHYPRTSGGGRSRKPVNRAEASEAMGIDWMSRKELSQAIPPAYTEYLGRQFLDQLARL